MKSVYCIASGVFQAEIIIDKVKAAGFHDDEISVLFADKLAAQALSLDSSTQAPTGSRMAEPVMLGGALAWLAGIRAVSIPELGSFIGAGPIMAALNGSGPGSIANTLISFGLTAPDANRLEAKAIAGSVLVGISSSERLSLAKQVLTKTCAQEICTSSDVSLPVGLS